MTQPKTPDPVKLFTGTLYSSADALAKTKAILESKFGAIDYESPPYAFDVTDYYEPEMGKGLHRIFWSFERLIAPDGLIEAKLFTNGVEGEGKRSVNIDPGYLDYYKVVLASAKFGGQKLYLGQGIYGDIVLWYEKGAFKPFIWGFPDFKNGRYDEALLEIRRRYHAQRTGRSV
jgi:hypothetical protein